MALRKASLSFLCPESLFNIKVRNQNRKTQRDKSRMPKTLQEQCFAVLWCCFWMSALSHQATVQIAQRNRFRPENQRLLLLLLSLLLGNTFIFISSELQQSSITIKENIWVKNTLMFLLNSNPHQFDPSRVALLTMVYQTGKVPHGTWTPSGSCLCFV